MFSFTRMGMYNTDPNWWDHNLALFEAITLPSMSQALHNPEDFWVMLVNKVSPMEAVRKLNTLIRNSPVRDKTYILYEDFVSYWGNQAKIHSDFVKQHVEPGEYFIKHQIDSDDAVAYDFFDKAREFVKEKTDEIGKESKFVFTFPNIYEFYIRQQYIENKNMSFNSHNGLTYDNNCEDFPWIHQMQFSPQGNYFIANKYPVFKIETSKPISCYLFHGSSNYDLRMSMWGKERKGKEGNESIYNDLRDFGIAKENVDVFLDRYPNTLEYYETRHTTECPFNNRIKSLKKELSEYYSLAKIALDYLDVEKKYLRERIAKEYDKNKTWLANLAQFYGVECAPNSQFSQINDGPLYLEKLANSKHNYTIAYNGEKCFVLYSAKGEIVKQSDPTFCRAKFTSSGKDNRQNWVKSIIENGVSVSSIEINGLEYSMNMEGLNIAILNGTMVADVVNINPNEKFKLRR